MSREFSKRERAEAVMAFRSHVVVFLMEKGTGFIQQAKAHLRENHGMPPREATYEAIMIVVDALHGIADGTASVAEQVRMMLEQDDVLEETLKGLGDPPLVKTDPPTC